MTAILFRETKAHDESGAVKPGAKLSSNEYVPCWLRDEDQPHGQLWIRPVDRCNHGITICPECAESWDIDYVVDYHRTLGGRALLEQMSTTATEALS
ncbi:hypothetical protein [Nocardia sp. NPDC051833]|uniref:hypothetical protein n=1 Tax=Nocardia sp. NPDC051833 TaxID=3155674 RepID=UPI003413437B